jgi:eukaryotic-like serine/threonine-protein kinase
MTEVLVQGHGTTAAGVAGDVFGRYRIIRTLAFGGMAQIVLAEELRSGRIVVIKRILPHYASNPEFVQFFIHEGRLGQRLRHPNLVETLEAGQVGDACYIALEYLRGQPAIELLRQAAKQQVEVPLGVAVRIVADAARGLHHAHIAVDNEGKPLGVVHRDVTPHNLFLNHDGQTKVLDFGIAKAASQLHQTRTGTIKGKFAYLAPEQIRGESIDRRVDVFALGIVLHELLTLRPLFRGVNDAETLNRVLSMEVPAPEHVRPGVPPGLGAVALRALQRDRERRLPSAEALADSIEAVAEAEGIDASPRAVADLLHELCPPDEMPLRVDTPPRGEEKLNPVVTGSQPAIELGPEDIRADIAHMGASEAAYEDSSDIQPIIELRHPKAVPALSDAAPPPSVRERNRLYAARAATLVVAAGGLAFLVFHAQSCLARLGHPAAAKHEHARPSELANPQAPTIEPVQATRPPVLEKRQPLGAPVEPSATTSASDNEGLVPAAPVQGDVALDDAILRVQTEGPATFTVDGRSQRVAVDGALHLPPGHHRVTVSAATLAFPRTLDLDLRPRESTVRTIARGRGSLRVAVTPWAEVTVDNHVVGVTPLQPIELGEGSHSVSLANRELGVVAKRKLVVAPDKETLLKLDLFGEKR